METKYCAKIKVIYKTATEVPFTQAHHRTLEKGD